jgi:hypothetical protein
LTPNPLTGELTQSALRNWASQQPASTGIPALSAAQTSIGAAPLVPGIAGSLGVGSGIPLVYGGQALGASGAALSAAAGGSPVTAASLAQTAQYTAARTAFQAGGAGVGTALTAMAPVLIPLAISLLRPLNEMRQSSNRLEASMQATNAVQRSLLAEDFNENNAARIRALTGLKGDTGQYGDVPNEGRVSSIGGALNRIQQAGGVDAIPTAGGKAMYNELLKEIEVRQLAQQRLSLGASADEQEQYASLSPEEVQKLVDARNTGQ